MTPPSHALEVGSGASKSRQGPRIRKNWEAQSRSPVPQKSTDPPPRRPGVGLELGSQVHALVPPLCSAGTPSWPHGPENTSPWLAPQGSPPHPVPFIPASESPDVVAPYGVWTHWPAPSGRSSPSMWPPGPESAGCMDSARTWRSPRRGPHHNTQGPRSSPVPTPKPPGPWGCKPFNSCRCSPLIGAIDRWTEPH